MKLKSLQAIFKTRNVLKYYGESYGLKTGAAGELQLRVFMCIWGLNERGRNPTVISVVAALKANNFNVAIGSVKKTCQGLIDLNYVRATGTDLHRACLKPTLEGRRCMEELDAIMSRLRFRYSIKRKAVEKRGRTRVRPRY